MGQAMHRPVCLFNRSLLPTRTGPRVEGDGDEVSLPREARRHLPDLPADRGPPVELLRSVALGNAPDELLEIDPAPDSEHRRHDESAVAHSHVHCVADVDLDIGEQLLAEAKALTVAPLLDSGDHLDLPLRLSEV